MAKFRKKPVIIEALQLTWDNWQEMCDFAGVGKMEDGKPQGCFLDENDQPLPDDHSSERIGMHIPTREGVMLAVQGDWVIKEPFPTDDRKFYPCKPSMFDATYESTL